MQRAIEEYEERPPGELGRAFDLMRANDYEAFRSLLDEHPELVHETYRGASTTLVSALAQPEQHHVQLRFAELLVERGADLREALNLAACFNHAPLVRLLAEAGAPQGPSEIWGLTPMQAAVYHGSREAADLLELTPNAFYLAAGAGRIDALDSAEPLRPNLTDVGWPPAELEQGRQAILDEAFALAAYNGRIEMLEELLRRGARLRGRAHGMTALRFAVIARRRDVIDWLVERGAARSVGEAFAAVSATWGQSGEVLLDSGLTYGGRAPVLVLAVKHEGRYTFSDEGRAFEAAGRPAGWTDAVQRLQADFEVNVGPSGVVSLPATEKRDLDWLTTLVDRIAGASAAFYGDLLELDEPLHSGA